LAIGLGVPVIGTDVDGFPDMLADGRGILVAPEDPEALARMLEQVLAGQRRTDTAAAREWARQFELDRVAAIYEHTYSELSQAVAL
jgi:glycosyltransferase involved in cell wall biosynthesis